MQGFGALDLPVVKIAEQQDLDSLRHSSAFPH